MVNSRPPMGAAKAVATPIIQKGKAVASPVGRGEKGRGGDEEGRVEEEREGLGMRRDGVMIEGEGRGEEGREGLGVRGEGRGGQGEDKVRKILCSSLSNCAH